MKKLILSTALLAPLSLAACAAPTYDLIISAYGEEYLEWDFKEKIEAKTGLKLRVVYHSSNEELERTMNSQKFDLIQTSEYMTAKLAEANKLEKLDATKFGFKDQLTYKSQFGATVSSALQSIPVGNEDTALNYMLPYTNGDIRFMLNKTKSSCKTALGVTDTSSVLDIAKMVSAEAKANCKIAVINDTRVISLLASNLDGATTADEANNPDIDSGFTHQIKNLKDSGIVRVDDDTIGLDYATGKYDVVFTWNTTPLWIFDEPGTTVTRDQTLSLGMGANHFNNLWIDGTNITKEGNVENSYKVLQAMYELRSESSAKTNAYNSPFIDVESALEQEYKNDPAFIISNNPAHHSTFKYKKGTDKEYSAKLEKAVSDNWS